MGKLAAGAIVLTLLASAATAQPPTPPSAAGEPETVFSDAQRQRDDDQSVSLDFLRTWLDPAYPSDEQFAFWRVKICPRVWGLTQQASWTVEHRIKDVAQQVGAPVDWADTCKTPNVLVIVTPDPQATLDDLADKVPILVAMQEIKRLKIKYPIQSWYVHLVGDYDGRRTVAIETDDGSPGVYKASGSRLESGLWFGLGMATVIVDAKAVTGLSLSALADYITMAGLSETVQRGWCHPVPSIANLMVKDCPAEEHSESLTELDLQMLTGLYHSDHAPGLLQRQRIAKMMREGLEKARLVPAGQSNR